jgi:hypothetical protein
VCFVVFSPYDTIVRVMLTHSSDSLLYFQTFVDMPLKTDAATILTAFEIQFPRFKPIDGGKTGTVMLRYCIMEKYRIDCC